MPSSPSLTEPELTDEIFGQLRFETDDADNDVSDGFILFSFGPASDARVTTDA